MSQAKLKPIYWLRNYLSENYQRKNDKFLGQVLTIIDASISDKEQRKGIKNLIQNEYYRDRRDVMMREIIFAYCQKYCPNTLPDTKEKEDVFLQRSGEFPIPNVSDPTLIEWNFEK